MTPAAKSSGWSMNRIFAAILAIIMVLAFWQIRNIMLLTFASVILVIFFTMPVRLFTRRFGINRPLAVVLSLIGFFILLIVLSLLVFPTLFDQFAVLATDVIPAGFNQFVEWWNRGGLYELFPFMKDFVDGLVIDQQMINQGIGTVTNALGSLGGSVIPLVGGVANSIVSFLVIVFLSIYFLSEPQRYIGGIITLTPVWYRGRMNEVLYRIDETLRAYLRVTAASMLVAGLGTGIGLALIGVRQWAALAVLTGVFSFIPNFGQILTLLAALAVGLVQTPDRIWLIVVVVYGVSFVETQVISPIIASEGMKIAPVLVLVGQIVCGIFFGFLGLVLAVPMTAVAKVLIEEMYVKDVLGDRSFSSVPLGHHNEELIPGGT
jgi:predicted PurR-regulated permease PerM